MCSGEKSNDSHRSKTEYMPVKVVYIPDVSLPKQQRVEEESGWK